MSRLRMQRLVPKSYQQNKKNKIEIIENKYIRF